MDYIQARDQIKTGDIIALSHEQWGSWYDLQVQAVRMFTESEYSHIALAWVYAGRVFVIESVEPVVRIFPLSNLSDKGFYHIPMGAEFSDAELEFLMSKVGVGKYSKLEAILAYFKKIKIGADQLWECAELAIAARRLSGVDLGNKATPSAVVKTLLENGHVLQYVKKA